jgi:hypothetical protein
MRGLVVFAAIVSVISLITGPLLFVWVRSLIDDNQKLICSLGELISSAPVAKRPDQTQAEYDRGVGNLREFAADLEDLADCGIKIEVVTEGEAVTEGGSGPQLGQPPVEGGDLQPGNPGQPPDPPPGGSPPDEPPDLSICVEQPYLPRCLDVTLP